MPPLLQDGIDALRRNWQSVAVLAAAYMLLSLGIKASFLLTASSGDEAGALTPNPVWMIVATLVSASVLSVAQAALFARIGKEIDRPLWKCRDDVDALTRFFIVWLLLNLSGELLLHLSLRFERQGWDDLSYIMVMLFAVVYLFYIPIGACIMHHGALNWDELGHTLAPISAQFSDFALVLLIRIATLALWFAALALEASQEWLFTVVCFQPLVQAPTVLLDCLAFAMMWRLCMIHRDSAHYRADDDFDF